MDVLGHDLLPVDIQQSQPIQYALFTLREYFTDLGLLFILAYDMPIRFDPADLRRAAVPDILFARGVDPEPVQKYPSNSYTIWEVGKPPDFVMEVASPSTYIKDVGEKPELYERMGIPEYWMFDYMGGMYYDQSLTGYRLVNGSYERIELFINDDGLECGYSEELGLNLCAADRSQWETLLERQPSLVFQEDYNPVQLMFQDPATGIYLLNAEGKRAAARRTEDARRRAETRALEAEAELVRLREHIRRLEEG